jgi:hypothetical protein
LQIEIEKVRLELRETEKRLELQIQLQLKETEARLRTEIYRSHTRVILWVAGLIAAQIPIFFLLQKLQLF